MLGIKVEVTFYGKEMKIDPETREVIKHRTEMLLRDDNDWKESCRRALEDALKFEGVSEIRFFVPNLKRSNRRRAILQLAP